MFILYFFGYGTGLIVGTGSFPRWVVHFAPVDLSLVLITTKAFSLWCILLDRTSTTFC
jgi:hypothetical protein